MFVVRVSGVVCTPSGLGVGADGSPSTGLPSSDCLGHRWSFGDAGQGIELLPKSSFALLLIISPNFQFLW